MIKKILVIGLICTFLILGLTTSSAVFIKIEIKSYENGQIICHVSDKNNTPSPEPKWLEGIRLVLKNNDETLILENLTDDKGQCIFEDLPYNDYKITAYGGFGYSNQTKDVPLKEPTVYVSFELTKKTRSINYLNSILLELFQHFPVLISWINNTIKI